MASSDSVRTANSARASRASSHRDRPFFILNSHSVILLEMFRTSRSIRLGWRTHMNGGSEVDGAPNFGGVEKLCSYACFRS
jgi:hypothetical protein